MWTLDYDFFFKQLKAGMCINETCFYFSDDPTEEEHYIGFLPEYDKPYWCSRCYDIPDGAEYETAEELVNAPIWNGKSLKERWTEVRICQIEGMCLESWIKGCKHV